MDHLRERDEARTQRHLAGLRAELGELQEPRQHVRPPSRVRARTRDAGSWRSACLLRSCSAVPLAERRLASLVRAARRSRRPRSRGRPASPHRCSRRSTRDPRTGTMQPRGTGLRRTDGMHERSPGHQSARDRACVQRVSLERRVPEHAADRRAQATAPDASGHQALAQRAADVARAARNENVARDHASAYESRWLPEPRYDDSWRAQRHRCARPATMILRLASSAT